MYPPSLVVTVIVHVPGATPVTVPALTVAIELLLEDQETPLLDALLGKTVAVNVLVSPTSRVIELEDNDTPVAGVITVVTSTVHQSVCPS